MKKSQLGQIQAVESTLKGLLKGGIHPHVIGVALNNAFVHGDALREGGFDCDDKVLGEIYDGIEKFSAACKKVE